MFRAVILLCIVAIAFCQYPRQGVSPRRPLPEYDAEPDYDDYQPRPRPPPQPVPQLSPNSVRLRPASVHYVNIGAELAGDYKFGYDTGKGDDGQSFREETRLPDGTVQGAYGYVDETGKQRIVKYTAGKEGFRVIKDNEAGSNTVATRPSPQTAQPTYRAPPQPARAPAYIPPPQPARAPSAPAYVPPPQPARAPPAPVYVPPPQPARATRPQTYVPQPAPAYRALPEPAYRPAPSSSRSRGSAPRRDYNSSPAGRRNIPDTEPDYDYPDNDIQERRLVPIDTSLFNYNIGTNRK